MINGQMLKVMNMEKCPTFGAFVIFLIGIGTVGYHAYKCEIMFYNY
jgi:hypothetical protein